MDLSTYRNPVEEGVLFAVEDFELEALARGLDRAAATYYRDVGPESALAVHEARSRMLSAVSRLPGRRWWRESTCYESSSMGLLAWSEPGRAPLPSRRRHGRPHLVSGPGVVPRAGRSLYPPRKRKVPA